MWSHLWDSFWYPGGVYCPPMTDLNKRRLWCNWKGSLWLWYRMSLKKKVKLVFLDKLGWMNHLEQLVVLFFLPHCPPLGSFSGRETRVMNNVPTWDCMDRLLWATSRIMHEITSSQRRPAKTRRLSALIQQSTPSLIWLDSASSSSFN